MFDLVYVWYGDAARSGLFEPGNSALRQFRDSRQGAVTSATFVESASTQYTPIRIFIGSPTLLIGAQISAKSPSDIDTSFVTCSIGENAPVWESWEQERVGARNPSTTSDIFSSMGSFSSVTPSTTPRDQDELSETSSPSSASSTAEENAVTTSSSTTPSTPTPVCEDGVEYAVYFFDNDGTECQELIETYSSQDPLHLNLAKVIDGKVPHATGITPNIYGLELNPQPGEPTTTYDYTTPSDVDASNSCTVVYHRGYLVLSNRDNSFPLSIYADVDDLIYIWGDDAALSGGYDPSNTIIRKVMGSWNNANTYYNFGVDDPTKFKRDDTAIYIPIRVFYANLPGPGQFDLFMYGSPEPRFITCSGDQSAPSWLPWDQERTFTSAPVCTPGLEYAIYTFSMGSPEYNALDDMVQSSYPLNLDLKTVIENQVPQHTGRTETIEWASNDETSPIAIYDFSPTSGPSLSDASLVVQHRGFVKFHGTGTYTFEVVGEPDTVLFAWIGNEALSGILNPWNSELLKLYQSMDAYSTTYQVAVSDTNRYPPIRVFYANLIGAGQFKVSISGPAGTPAPSLVQCSGTGDLPGWLPWAEEEVGIYSPGADR